MLETLVQLMDQDSEATELLQRIITAVHWLLIQHLPVAKQTDPYIVHFFFSQCVASGRKKKTPLTLATVWSSL